MSNEEAKTSPLKRTAMPCPFCGNRDTDMIDAIAYRLLEYHMALMAENMELRHKADKLNTAMLMLAKLRDSAHYPKGVYSSDIQTEWDAMLNQWFGEVRPCFHS